MALVLPRSSRSQVVLVTYIILAWMVLALLAGLTGLFVVPLHQPPLAFALAAVGPVVLWIVAYAVFPNLRAFTRALVDNPWGITAMQAYRVVAGLAFLVAYWRGQLPADFALPAGWGDILVGVTAPLVALTFASQRPFGRIVFVLWNLLGILDLVNALAIGAVVLVFLQSAASGV